MHYIKAVKLPQDPQHNNLKMQKPAVRNRIFLSFFCRCLRTIPRKRRKPMGKTDVTVNQLMERKEIFADFINGVIYQGKKVIQPENLEMLSSSSGLLYEEDSGKVRTLERRGDVRMKADIGTYSIIFSEENQKGVHYAMPVRNMLYDALEYVKQLQELEKIHKKNGEVLQGNEFLSGITKEDRLAPVITTVFYFGDQWDGAESLYGMMDLGGEMKLLKKYLPNYKINLVHVDSIKNTNVFDSCLQQIFDMLRCRKDKKKLYRYVNENREKLLEMDSVEMTAAMMLMGEQKRLIRMLKQEKKGEFVMCQAIDELIEDGRLEGLSQGRSEGLSQGRAVSILDLLEDLGAVADGLRERIMQQKDLEILKKWLRFAASADTVEAFRAKAGI